eukprot:scaffold7052_cov254-Pinguiococcus_pyrenoidosus.AAC.75
MPRLGVGSSKPRNKRKVLQKTMRRRINGETKALVKHAQRAKTARGDFTVDDDWTAAEELRFADRYVEAISFAYLGFKVLILSVVLFLSCLPLAVWAQVHAKSLHHALEKVDWKVYSSLVCKVGAYVVIAPLLLPLLMSYSLDVVCYYVFSVPYALGSESGLARYRESSELLKAFRGGPMFRLGDFFVCLASHAKRRDARSVATSLTAMILFVPWLKYFVNCNPFIYPLKELFRQNMSASLQDVGVKAVTHSLRRFLSEPTPEPALVHAFSEMLPFFPFPKSKRRWAMGIQSVGGVSLLSHVTHADARVQGSQEQFVLSRSAERPIYRGTLAAASTSSCVPDMSS